MDTITPKVEVNPPEEKIIPTEVSEAPLKCDIGSFCASCNKKLSVISRLQCKCQNYYCKKHFFADSHSCTYDYRGLNKEILDKTNPKVDFSKVDKI